MRLVGFCTVATEHHPTENRCQFSAPSSKRLLIQTRALADQAEPASSEPVRLQGCDPALLSLVQVSEQRAQLLMPSLLGVAGLLLAESARAFVRRGHVRILLSLVHETGK